MTVAKPVLRSHPPNSFEQVDLELNRFVGDGIDSCGSASNS